MRIARYRIVVLLMVLVSPLWASAVKQPPATQPTQVVQALVQRVLALAEPTAQTPAKTFSARLLINKADGLPKGLPGASLNLAYQAPDRLLLTAQYGGGTYSACRNGQELWAYMPAKRFGVVGVPGVLRFADDPQSMDATVLPPFKIPLSIRAEVLAASFMLQVEDRGEETVGDARCRVLVVSAPKAVADAIGLPSARLELVMTYQDEWPRRLRFTDGRRVTVEVEVEGAALAEPWAAEKWELKGEQGDKIERVALSHLTKFLKVAQSALNNRIRTLGPVKGERKLIATAGQGRLEEWDGTRVLFLKGTPEAMGRQHGTLLRREVRDVSERMLYGVGVASSFEKSSWFISEIEAAQRRLHPFVSERHFAEVDAMADAAGIARHEMRLANFFPELFHCSGFSVFGQATVDGRMYHGRVLDYLKGVGLEQNAVVMVFQPDVGHAWVNVGYAGFVGSVTAMNEKHVSIGEMGGRGEGNWDGKPMAQLMREVMEKASTLEEAVEIMRKGPRTCEYYYVISDGKSKRAVGLECSPTKFVTVWPGDYHPQLQQPVKDAVLVSAGSRYEKLVERVKGMYGKLDDAGARALMERPVCMTSNIQSVLFAPETLDFWVANADSKNVASHTRYTHYNLGDLLKAEPAKKP